MPAADGRVFALKQVKLAGMKRVDRQEAIDEVSFRLLACFVETMSGIVDCFRNPSCPLVTRLAFSLS
jgi:hypothetical protein